MFDTLRDQESGGAKFIPIQNTKPKPIIVPSNEGRKMFVLGQEITLKLTGNETGGAYYVFEALTPPGVGVPTHVHEHEDEILRIIEGEYEVFLDGKTYKAGQGAVINLPRLIPHRFGNVGKKPGRATTTVIPGINFEKFFEELSSLSGEQWSDMAKVEEICKRYDIQILEPSSASALS
jgi:mannose-6-phosphate isomerase-like protein (cupin superfamily)